MTCATDLFGSILVFDIFLCSRSQHPPSPSSSASAATFAVDTQVDTLRHTSATLSGDTFSPGGDLRFQESPFTVEHHTNTFSTSTAMAQNSRVSMRFLFTCIFYIITSVSSLTKLHLFFVASSKQLVEHAVDPSASRS